MEGNKITQKCYINIAKKLFFLYYNQDYNKTQKMFDNIADFTYKTHLYIYIKKITIANIIIVAHQYI